MKKFSEFSKEKIFDGDKIKIEEILNQEVIILNYKTNDSKYDDRKDGKCLTLHIEYNKERRVIFSGSEVLISQIKEYECELPFMATIKKIGKCYKLT